MSEKIPAEMLSAATEVVSEYMGWDDHQREFAKRMTTLALEAAGVAALVARVAELEADTKRLRWLTDNAGIDGFYGVVDDRYDLAMRIAGDRSHDEPTADDEFDGFRQLIDLAMKSTEPHGAARGVNEKEG